MAFGGSVPGSTAGQPAAAGAVGPNAPNPTSRPGLRRALTYGLVVTVFLVCLLALGLFLGVDLGPRTAAIAAVFAAVPLLVVVPTFLWLDRLEAEPTRYLLFAFLWGALCAPVGALVLNTSASVLLQAAGFADPRALTAVLTAPPVEEALKGLAVLLVLLVRRREFDGVVDGIVYGGLAGAGFAFSENILYLGRAYAEYGVAGLNAVFVLRGVMAPFSHPLFTVCTGIGLGLAVSVARSGWGRALFALAGFSCAVLLHAIWNLSAIAGQYLAVYVLFQVPVFLGFLVLVLVMRVREASLIRRYLSQYADAGWFTHSEVAMLASVPARRAARRWARANGGPAALAAMRTFQDAASDLALLRSRMVRGTAETEAREHELQLLASIAAHRSAFVGSPVL